MKVLWDSSHFLAKSSITLWDSIIQPSKLPSLYPLILAYTFTNGTNAQQQLATLVIVKMNLNLNIGVQHFLGNMRV